MSSGASRTVAVEVGGGRRLDVRVSGPAGVTPLVFHHGTPSSLPLRVVERAAHARGLRLVTIARPGYASSTPQPGRAIVDAAADTGDVLRALGEGACLVAGWSGGGPHALACAARLPEARAALVVAGVAPLAAMDADGLDWLAGMGEANVAEFGAALDGPASLRGLLDAQRAEMADAAPDELALALASLLPAVDRAAFSGELADDLAMGAHDALSTGIEGWLEDDLAFVGPWGFDPADVALPVTLWQGTADLMVPPAHGDWLAARLPNVRAHFDEGAGHLSLLASRIDAMLDELLELAG